MGWYDTILPSSQIPATYQGFPLDMDDWTCEQWKAYYLRNKEAQGQAKAKEIFDIDSSRIGMFSYGKSYCTFDCELLKFFAGEGLNYSSFVTNVYCGLVNITSAGKDVTQSASNVTGFLSSLTGNKLIMWGLLAYGGYRLYDYHANKKKK
jgi:hypothetical protein